MLFFRIDELRLSFDVIGFLQLKKCILINLMYANVIPDHNSLLI